jgi:hypothetical protein
MESPLTKAYDPIKPSANPNMFTTAPGRHHLCARAHECACLCACLCACVCMCVCRCVGAWVRAFVRVSMRARVQHTYNTRIGYAKDCETWNHREGTSGRHLEGTRQCAQYNGAATSGSSSTPPIYINTNKSIKQQSIPENNT